MADSHSPHSIRARQERRKKAEKENRGKRTEEGRRKEESSIIMPGGFLPFYGQIAPTLSLAEL